MKFEVLDKVPFIKRRLDSRLAYYAGSLFSIEKKRFVPIENDKKRIVIVAKSHYSQLTQTYRSISKNELKKLLSLKKLSENNSHSIYQVTANANVDGFDVKTIKFSIKVFDALGYANIYIPETELFHDEKEFVLQLETPLGRLFSSSISNKINSAYAKGIVSDIDTYRLSAGISINKNVVNIPADDFPSFLLNSLNKLPLKRLSQLALINTKSLIDLSELHKVYWAPLITALIFYILTNTFLAFNIYSLEASLKEGGEEVANVLRQKNDIDSKKALLEQLSTELSMQSLTHYHWDIVYQLVEQGATLNRVSYKSGVITVRGYIDKASELLAHISEHRQVKSATFKGAVRKVSRVKVL